MKLYINNKEAYFNSDFDVNMSFRFLDTYSPSAIKTSYSKTVSLPDCKQNAEIFGGFKVRYDFDLFNDDGRVIEKGYCTLDNVTTVGTQKTYNITLYGGLGDFFYNLKGDEDKPKSLVDLYWGDVTGLTPEQENSQSLMTWDPTYVYNTWINFKSSSLWDTFRAVPCIYDDGILDKSLTIIPAGGKLFPSSSEESGEAFVGQDGSRALLVEADENTCYGKQDFRSELMPLGIKYKSIIEACCKPINNGGYQVTLDPDFFNATNPYWSQLFLLKGLPTLDYDYTTQTNEFNNLSCSLASVGNYTSPSLATQAVSSVVPGGPSGPWEIEGNNFKAQAGVTLIDNKVDYYLVPFIEIPVNAMPSGTDDSYKAYITPKSTLQIQLRAVNGFSGETRTLASKAYTTKDRFKSLHGTHKGAHITVTTLYVGEALQGVVSLPASWTNFRLEIVAVNPSPSRGFTLHYNQKFLDIFNDWKTKTVKGDFKVPTDKDYEKEHIDSLLKAVLKWIRASDPDWELRLPDSFLTVVTDYVNQIDAFKALKFTKKDLLKGTNSPFEYLTWFTKMFNLRFYLEPGTKKVSILTADNFIKQLEPINIQDKVCYDKDYVRTRKIIDEGYLKFNLEPSKNTTVESYKEDVDENLLDYVYPISILEGKGEKEYLNTTLKIGSKARNKSSLNLRQTGSLSYYGFNQGTAYKVTYTTGSGASQEYRSDDLYLNNNPGLSRYDFLTLDDDILNTVVLYSGLKNTPFEDSPAIISKTSVDMVRLAGSPCWITGISRGTQGSVGSLLGASYKSTYKVPHYGLVPSLDNYADGLSYSNVDYESLIVTSNIYDRYLKNFIERIYEDPLVVECYVRLSSPELRRLYWFDNNYWILTEISNYNYRDEPVKCKFIRYRTDV